MRSWDARASHRPTSEELNLELIPYYEDYYKYKYYNINVDSEIVIQIKKKS